MEKLILLIILFFPSIAFSAQSWTEYPSTPVLSPSVSWEGTSVQEPSIVTTSTGSLFMMYHGYDGTHDSLGSATSPDGIIWTKSASNPLIGNGNGGVSGNATHHSLFKEGNIIYCFYVDANTTGNLWRIQSVDDGVTWTNKTQIISNVGLPGGTTGLTNTNVVKSGSVYYLYVELFTGAYFIIYRAISTDLTNWTFTPTVPITTLKIGGSGQTSSGPDIHIIKGQFYMWYHADSVGATIPTDIYFATSTNLLNWTQSGGIIISRASEINLGSFPGGTIDQVADPSVSEINGSTFIYYSRVHNSAPFTTDISMRSFNGTINAQVGASNIKSKLVNSSLIKGTLN